MRAAVLSGKGGTGKTFLAVNLAAAAKGAAYIDCDAEEPNGRLFLRPDGVTPEPVTVPYPEFDARKCTGCRKCVDFCRFNALVYVGGSPRLFPEVCHACGGCALVCPAGAVSETRRRVGTVESGVHGHISVVTGVLNAGEVSAVPVIRAALDRGLPLSDTVIIDCPPGSGCPVIESASACDVCVIAAEPTAFGLHNFRMAWRLASLLGKPCCAVINKITAPYPPLDGFCAEHKIPVLLRIPYDGRLAALGAKALIAAEEDKGWRDAFAALLEKVREAACG